MGRLRQAGRLGLVAVVLTASAPVVRADGTGEVERLRREVRVLAEALATTRLESDELRARLDGRAYEQAGGVPGREALAVAGGKEYRVLDVDRELGMVILNGGRRDGLRPGMQFAVISGQRTVATVRIVDVRTAVAGAVIQELGRGGPSVRDRAVLVTGSGN